MNKLLLADDRGRSQYDWLSSRHSFSFGHYDHPDYRGFRNLRVINHDIFKAQSGFPPHPHRDMEIITYVLRGEVTHEDNQGHKAVIRPNYLQRMTAGTGIVHSEFNLGHEPVEMLQMWIEPQQKGLAPAYQEVYFSQLEGHAGLLLLGSPTASSDALQLQANASLYHLRLRGNTIETLELREFPNAWVQMLKGEMRVNSVTLHKDDGLAIEQEPAILLQATTDAEALIFLLS